MNSPLNHWWNPDSSETAGVRLSCEPSTSAKGLASFTLCVVNGKNALFNFVYLVLELGR